MNKTQTYIERQIRNKTIGECQNYIVEYTGRYSGENEVIAMELEALKEKQ